MEKRATHLAETLLKSKGKGYISKEAIEKRIKSGLEAKMPEMKEKLAKRGEMMYSDEDIDYLYWAMVDALYSVVMDVLCYFMQYQDPYEYMEMCWYDDSYYPYYDPALVDPYPGEDIFPSGLHITGQPVYYSEHITPGHVPPGLIEGSGAAEMGLPESPAGHVPPGLAEGHGSGKGKKKEKKGKHHKRGQHKKW